MRTAALLAVGASAKTYFSETFDDMNAWTQSKWKPAAEMAEFKLQAGKYHGETKEEQCFATTEDARFYGASATFDSFSNEDTSLIVQYSVKYDKDIECGGGYVKLGPKIDDQEKFGDPTAYNIMFGPDKCGYTKRTHLIFNYKDKNVLKKSDLPYKQNEEGVSSLYRMTLKPDSTVVVKINDEEVYSGALEKDWDLLDAKEIDDPDDKKPDDWVDEAMIDDPEDKKPEDWVDEEQIVDKEAKQPEDWDAEEDGEWEPPMKDNPDYKGEWSAKRISNPAYKGVWAPKKIANPKYEANDKLYLYKDFSFVGLDLWQVKSGAHFDNIIITDDEAEADKFAEKWKAVNKVEKEKKAADKPPEDTKPMPDDDEDEKDLDVDKDDDADDDQEDL